MPGAYLGAAWNNRSLGRNCGCFRLNDRRGLESAGLSVSESEYIQVFSHEGAGIIVLSTVAADIHKLKNLILS